MEHFLDSIFARLITSDDLESLSLEDLELVRQYYSIYQNFREFRISYFNKEVIDKNEIEKWVEILADDKIDIFNKARTAQKVLLEIVSSKTIYEYCRLVLGDWGEYISEEIELKIESFLNKSAQLRKISKGKEKIHKEIFLAAQNEYDKLGGNSFFMVANTPYLEVMANVSKYCLILNSTLDDLEIKLENLQDKDLQDPNLLELDENSTINELLQALNTPPNEKSFNSQKAFIEKFGLRLLKTVEYKKYLDAVANFNSEDDTYLGTEFKIERQAYALKIILKELGATSKVTDQTDITRFCQFLTKRCLGVPKIHHSELYKNIIKDNVNKDDKEFVKNQFKKIGLEHLYIKYQ